MPPTQQLPPIQARAQGVVVYRKKQAQKKGFFPALISRVLGWFGRGAGAGGSGAFGSAVSAGGGSLLQTISTQGLLVALASSKIGLFAVGMGVIAAAVFVGVVATQWKSWTAKAPAQTPATAPFAQPKVGAAKLELKAMPADLRQTATPGGISSLNYLKMPANEATEGAPETGTTPAYTADDFASAIKSAKANPKSGKDKDTVKSTQRSQIAPMKGSVSPTLSGKGGGSSGGKMLNGRGGYGVDKGGPDGGGRSGAPRGYRNGAEVKLREPVRKGSLHAGRKIDIPFHGAISQAYGARADNSRAMTNVGQGTSQAAGSTYDGGSRRSMLGNSKNPSANKLADTKNVSMNPPAKKQDNPLPTPPPIGPAKNDSPWQSALMAAMGLLSLAKALMSMAKSKRQAASSDPDPQSSQALQNEGNQDEQDSTNADNQANNMIDGIHNGDTTGGAPQPGDSSNLGDNAGSPSMPSMPSMPSSGGGDNSSPPSTPPSTPTEPKKEEAPPPVGASHGPNEGMGGAMTSGAPMDGIAVGNPTGTVIGDNPASTAGARPGPDGTTPENAIVG